MKYIKEMGLMIFLLTFITSVSVWTELQANCTGCGEEGHGICLEDADHSHDTIQEHEHIEGEWLDHKHIEEGAMSNPPEVVFAVCVFADGTLVDHKGANSMSDCLKTKREV